jgi:hypothetical protein
MCETGPRILGGKKKLELGANQRLIRCLLSIQVWVTQNWTWFSEYWNLTEIGSGKTGIRMYLFEEPNPEPNSRFHFCVGLEPVLKKI